MSGDEDRSKPEAQTDEALAALLKRHGLDDCKAVMAYRGGEDFVKPGLGQRRRTRLELVDESGSRHVLFLKRYEGPPSVRGGMRRWWRHGLAYSPAEVEARNIEAARQAGVHTMRCAAWQAGVWGSYVITTAVPGEALERCPPEFWQRMTNDESAGSALALALADLLRKLHAAGYAHRDLYTAHVFVDERQGRPELYLIDLARMLSPRWRQFRWWIKDLSQLHFSLPAQWRDKWWELLLQEYLGEGLRHTAPRWQHAIGAKSRRMARHYAKRHADVRENGSAREG